MNLYNNGINYLRCHQCGEYYAVSDFILYGTTGGSHVDCPKERNIIMVNQGGSNCLQKPYNIHRNRLKTLAFYY